MRLLFDEQLSEELIVLLQDVFPDSLHVRQLGVGGAADQRVWQLARELFPAQIGTRTLTPGTYDGVRAAYRACYGDWAGWAQQYLYHGRRVARVLPMPSDVRLTDA